MPLAHTAAAWLQADDLDSREKALLALRALVVAGGALAMLIHASTARPASAAAPKGWACASFAPLVMRYHLNAAGINPSWAPHTNTPYSPQPPLHHRPLGHGGAAGGGRRGGAA